MTTGKVWLVGAGPSDAGLLTLKGKKILESADVVVYDALVGAEILSMIPRDAEVINVGKRASHHIRKQEEINEILWEKAKEGKRVVRLKGGDPFLFGRGGEELQRLAEDGIPFEIVPGVTSAVSVPAYNGIPVTHRDFCSSLHIITGHKKQDQPLDLPFQSLVDCGGTLVFLMGLAALSDICSGLLKHGMASDMPAAVLQSGTTAEQRRVVAALADLPRKVKESGIGTPAIIVVGKVCSLSDDFAWLEKKELFGCRVIITRPQGRSSQLTDRLRDRGAQVIEIPSIRTVALEDQKKLESALDRLSEYQWIAFTSPAGVPVFMDVLKKKRKDVRSLSGCRIAALGSGTAKALEQYGIFPDLVPDTYDGEHLGRQIAAEASDGDHILLPRARLGGSEIVKEIEKNPTLVLDDIPIYDTLYEKTNVLDPAEELRCHPQTMAVFTSASTVRGFLAAAEGIEKEKIKALCIGSKTAEAASQAGMQVFVAKKATLDSLEELVCCVHASQK
ncbi:MAG: uroporphyrinogen-III C-methyltransferase [Clostridiales bacterium]|nr:uroporphyrinogen-III C-methyltransferase [Clostridiales bacterium]